MTNIFRSVFIIYLTLNLFFVFFVSPLGVEAGSAVVSEKPQ